jgi:CheY-like chemotaxis protein
MIEDRVSALDVGARRLLQACAVLGVESPRAPLVALHGPVEPEARATLVTAGLARETVNGTLRLPTLVREVVHAAMPAEVRRSLHRRALEVARRFDHPLEAIARHAELGADPPSSLIWMERAGSTALAIGATGAAVEWLGRALALARLAHAAAPDDVSGSALAIFARKLSTALLRLGRAAEAEGVVRETLRNELSPAQRESLRMFLATTQTARASASIGLSVSPPASPLVTAARAAERCGDSEVAAQHWEEVRDHAAEAGDAETVIHATRRIATLRTRGLGDRGRSAEGSTERRSLVLATDVPASVLFTAVLDDAGIPATVARSWKEAQAVLSEQRFDLIVCAAGAEGLRDVDVLARLLDAGRGAQVFFVPQRDDAETREAALRLGTTWVVGRPRALDDLETVAAAIGRPGARAPRRASPSRGFRPGPTRANPVARIRTTP